MTLGEFSGWLDSKIFKTKEGSVFMKMSPNSDEQGIMQTRDENGRMNSCSYFLENEDDTLFMSYMDKEYLIRMLPDSSGFELIREGTIDQTFHIVHDLVKFQH